MDEFLSSIGFTKNLNVLSDISNAIAFQHKKNEKVFVLLREAGTIYIGKVESLKGIRLNGQWERGIIISLPIVASDQETQKEIIKIVTEKYIKL
ncbi:MAG: hypothetical protein WC875_03195 [Candidatus Absconditabacterales bacterium]|jgi:hypothetical protein